MAASWAWILTHHSIRNQICASIRSGLEIGLFLQGRDTFFQFGVRYSGAGHIEKVASPVSPQLAFQIDWCPHPA